MGSLKRLLMPESGATTNEFAGYEKPRHGASASPLLHVVQDSCFVFNHWLLVHVLKLQHLRGDVKFAEHRLQTLAEGAPLLGDDEDLALADPVF